LPGEVSQGEQKDRKEDVVPINDQQDPVKKETEENEDELSSSKKEEKQIEKPANDSTIEDKNVNKKLPRASFNRSFSLPIINTKKVDSKEEEPIDNRTDSNNHILTDVKEEPIKRVKKVTRIFMIEVVKCEDCVKDPLLKGTINEARAAKHA